MKSIAEITTFLQTSLLTELHVVGYTEFAVNQLALDSRTIQQNDGFIAMQGGSQHGLNHLQAVLTKQPGLVISDRVLNQVEQTLINAHNASLTQHCVVLVVDNLADNLGVLAHWFYEQPSKRIKVVGITGTNGKTSTAFYAAQLLEGLGQRTALIGTLGNGLFSDLQTTLNTTPDVVSVHRLLAEFITLGAQWVLMEVSSHALELGRIQQVVFESVALTQITRDHMDFHGSVEHYQRAKQKLFTDYTSKHQILNLNDEIGVTLATSGKLASVFSYACSHREQQAASIPIEVSHADLLCKKLQLKTNGLSFILDTQGQSLEVETPLLGSFNVENILCACAILLASRVAGFAGLSLQRQVANLQSVTGRMQRVKQLSTRPSATVIVDFAHTPDALEQVLLAVKQHLIGDDRLNQSQASVKPSMKATRPGQLWVVFGCGGDRDQGKRPLMAAVTEQIADKVMVTDDNPRFENSQQIRQQIFSGFKKPQAVLQQADRQLAIEEVLVQASPEDIVVIAGKGHELYQDIQGVKTPFSDEQIVLDWLDRPLEQSPE